MPDSTTAETTARSRADTKGHCSQHDERDASGAAVGDQTLQLVGASGLVCFCHLAFVK